MEWRLYTIMIDEFHIRGVLFEGWYKKEIERRERLSSDDKK